MIIAAEVTCYWCSRICGEAEGDEAERLLPHAVRSLGGLCSVYPTAPLRCARCGGPVYLEVVHRSTWSEQEFNGGAGSARKL